MAVRDTSTSSFRECLGFCLGIEVTTIAINAMQVITQGSKSRLLCCCNPVKLPTYVLGSLRQRLQCTYE